MIRRTLQQYLLRDARCFADLRRRPRVPAQRRGGAAVICYLKKIFPTHEIPYTILMTYDRLVS